LRRPPHLPSFSAPPVTSLRYTPPPNVASAPPNRPHTIEGAAELAGRRPSRTPSLSPRRPINRPPSAHSPAAATPSTAARLLPGLAAPPP
jgi:hypothetical protein